MSGCILHSKNIHVQSLMTILILPFTITSHDFYGGLEEMNKVLSLTSFCFLWRKGWATHTHRAEVGIRRSIREMSLSLRDSENL